MSNSHTTTTDDARNTCGLRAGSEEAAATSAAQALTGPADATDSTLASSSGVQRVDRIGAARLLTSLGLPIAATTLAKRAVHGNGPPYQIWCNRATYDVETLLAWARDRLGKPLSNTARKSESGRSSVSRKDHFETR